MGKSNRLGAWGEALAAEYLRDRGYRILSCGFRCPFGEIDLIAQRGRFLAIIEVKLRKSADFAQAMEFVDSKKQARIRTTALHYLSENHTRLQPRFDVIEIYAPKGTDTLQPQIHHIKDAFQ